MICSNRSTYSGDAASPESKTRNFKKDFILIVHFILVMLHHQNITRNPKKEFVLIVQLILVILHHQNSKPETSKNNLF